MDFNLYSAQIESEPITRHYFRKGEKVFFPYELSEEDLLFLSTEHTDTSELNNHQNRSLVLGPTVMGHWLIDAIIV